MEKHRKQTLTSIGKNVTAIVSVALVILVLGIVGELGLGIGQLSHKLKEQIGFNVVLAEGVESQSVDSLCGVIKGCPQVAVAEIRSAEEILAEESRELNLDILDVVGENPYLPEISVRLVPEISDPEEIKSVAAQFESSPVVDHVDVINQVVEVAGFIRSLTLVLLIVAAALIVISFVLIGNTVRLAIYSSRFLLNTMQLVGATRGFIRRPIVAAYVGYGVISGVLAIAILAGLRFYAAAHFRDAGVELDSYLSWGTFAIVGVGMIICGMVICGASSWMATNRYLKKSYDKLF